MDRILITTDELFDLEDVAKSLKKNKNEVDKMFNEMQMDNFDKNDVKQVAYYLHVMHDDIEEDDVMGTKFWEACEATWEDEFSYLDWNEIKNEIEENYI